MENKEQILDLFYNSHLKQTEIAEIVKLSTQYISKVVKKDSRYEQEKAYRKKLSKESRQSYLKDFFKNYKRPKKDDDSYMQLQAQLKQDSLELSFAGGYISDNDFAKWNSNAYEGDKNGNLKLVKGLKVGSDVPKTINKKKKVPTQKYKKKYCYSR